MRAHGENAFAVGAQIIAKILHTTRFNGFGAAGCLALSHRLGHWLAQQLVLPYATNRDYVVYHAVIIHRDLDNTLYSRALRHSKPFPPDVEICPKSLSAGVINVGLSINDKS